MSGFPSEAMKKLYEKTIADLLQPMTYLPPLSEEQKTKNAERAVRWNAYKEALRSYEWPKKLRPIFDLHSENKYGCCLGCDFAGWEAEEPSWPCRSVKLLGTLVGIEDFDASE